jgi:hypothetical protein
VKEKRITAERRGGAGPKGWWVWKLWVAEGGIEAVLAELDASGLVVMRGSGISQSDLIAFFKDLDEGRISTPRRPTVAGYGPGRGAWVAGYGPRRGRLRLRNRSPGERPAHRWATR